MCALLSVQPAHNAPAFVKPSGRLERDTTAEQLRALGGDAGITKDLGLGYSIPQPAAAEVAAPAAAAPAAGAAAAAGGGGGSSRQQQQQGGAKPASSSKPRSSSGSQKPKGGAPIILVPSGVSALFNMFNARQFLQDGVYIRR